MRPVYIIAALGVVALLHLWTWHKSSIARSPEMSSRQPVDVLSPVRLADIDSCRPGDRLTVTGRVSDIWEPAGERAPHTVILRDDSGALEVVHWLKQPLRAVIGDFVECTGTIDLYRGELQLRLWSAKDFDILGR